MLDLLLLAVLSLLLGACAPARRATAARDARAASGHQEVRRLADGVYAVIRHEPIAFANNANSLLVIGPRDVLVVDAQFTRAATLEVLAALRRLTDRPVRYVVNTHWHDDHVAGNQVYADSFPGVRFLAHRHTRTDLVEKGRPNRRSTLAVGPSFTARLVRLMAQGLGGDSTPIVPRERRALASTDSIMRQYLAESATYREVLPDSTFDDRITLAQGERTIEVRYVGPANTRGDAIVWLPRERIVATGDIVVAPIPFAFDAHPARWSEALDTIVALRPAAIVPGHGPVLHDDGYLTQLARMLRAIDAGARAVAARGGTVQDAHRTVTLDDDRRRMAGDDKWLGVLFRSFFLGPGVTAAFAEATAGADATRSTATVHRR